MNPQKDDNIGTEYDTDFESTKTIPIPTEVGPDKVMQITNPKESQDGSIKRELEDLLNEEIGEFGNNDQDMFGELIMNNQVTAPIGATDSMVDQLAPEVDIAPPVDVDSETESDDVVTEKYDINSQDGDDGDYDDKIYETDIAVHAVSREKEAGEEKEQLEEDDNSKDEQNDEETQQQEKSRENAVFETKTLGSEIEEEKRESDVCSDNVQTTPNDVRKEDPITESVSLEVKAPLNNTAAAITPVATAYLPASISPSAVSLESVKEKEYLDEIGRLKNLLIEKNGEIYSLQIKLNQKENENIRCIKSLDDLTAEYKRLVNEKDMSINQWESKAHALEAEITSLRASNNEALSKLEATNTNLISANSRLRSEAALIEKTLKEEQKKRIIDTDSAKKIEETASLFRDTLAKAKEFGSRVVEKIKGYEKYYESDDIEKAFGKQLGSQILNSFGDIIDSLATNNQSKNPSIYNSGAATGNKKYNETNGSLAPTARFSIESFAECTNLDIFNGTESLCHLLKETGPNILNNLVSILATYALALVNQCTEIKCKLNEAEEEHRREIFEMRQRNTESEAAAKQHFETIRSTLEGNYKVLEMESAKRLSSISKLEEENRVLREKCRRSTIAANQMKDMCTILQVENYVAMQMLGKYSSAKKAIPTIVLPIEKSSKESDFTSKRSFQIDAKNLLVQNGAINSLNTTKEQYRRHAALAKENMAVDDDDNMYSTESIDILSSQQQQPENIVAPEVQLGEDNKRGQSAQPVSKLPLADGDDEFYEPYCERNDSNGGVVTPAICKYGRAHYVNITKPLSDSSALGVSSLRTPTHNKRPYVELDVDPDPEIKAAIDDFLKSVKETDGVTFDIKWKKYNDRWVWCYEGKPITLFLIRGELFTKTAGAQMSFFDYLTRQHIEKKMRYGK